MQKIGSRLAISFAVIFIGLLIHLICAVGTERGLCLKKGKIFNFVFTFAVVILGISFQSLGFSAEALKVVATTYCSNSFDLLANESYTVNFLPDELKGFATRCFYYAGNGDLSSLQTEKVTKINYWQVREFLNIVSKASGFLNLAPKQSVRV